MFINATVLSFKELVHFWDILYKMSRYHMLPAIACYINVMLEYSKGMEHFRHLYIARVKFVTTHYRRNRFRKYELGLDWRRVGHSGRFRTHCSKTFGSLCCEFMG
jgi:hypothetical protein